MPDLRMPGVYTLEKSTLPPTIGVIPSAVPVFIGYTEKAEKKGEQLENKPTKVKSMKEYEDWFGGPPKVALEVDIDDRIDNPLRPEARVVPPAGFVHKMYHSMLFYYANAGGQCWVVSVGDYDEAPSYDKLQKAIDLLKKVKDVTILVFPDGTSLTESKYAALIAKALTHCEVSKNRVTIIDLHNTNGEDITKIEDGFQTNMPAESDLKKYGMAYYPYVDTIFSHAFDGAGVTVRNHYQTLPADQTTADKIKAELKKLSDPLTEAATKYTDAVKALKALQSEKGITDDLLKKLQDFKALNPAATDAEVKAELDRLVTADEVTIPADIKTELDKPDPKALTILDTASKAYPAKITAAQAAADTAKAPFLTAAKLSAKGVSVADPV